MVAKRLGNRSDKCLDMGANISRFARCREHPSPHGKRPRELRAATTAHILERVATPDALPERGTPRGASMHEASSERLSSWT
jgi:hypothetical protein